MSKRYKNRYEDDLRKMDNESERMDWQTIVLVMFLAAGATIATILGLIIG